MIKLSDAEYNELAPIYRFIREHLAEYLDFLEQTRPEYKTKTWRIGTKTISIRFRPDADCKEHRNHLQNSRS